MCATGAVNLPGPLSDGLVRGAAAVDQEAFKCLRTTRRWCSAHQFGDCAPRVCACGVEPT